MKHAFGKNGLLRMDGMGKDKCQAIVDLFSGSTVVYSEPLTDRRGRSSTNSMMVQNQVNEVVEQILSANLLHRYLDQVEAGRGFCCQGLLSN